MGIVNFYMLPLNRIVLYEYILVITTLKNILCKISGFNVSDMLDIILQSI